MPPTSKGGLAGRITRAWRALAREQRLAGGAALALWATMFLPWYSKTTTFVVKGSAKPASYTLTAWQAFSFVEASVLLVSAGILYMLFARGEQRAFHLPGGDGFIVMLAGIWTGLLVFYRMLDKPGTTGTAQLTTTFGIQWGIFFALAACGALIWAGTRVRVAHRPEPALSDDPTVPVRVAAGESEPGVTRRMPRAAPTGRAGGLSREDAQQLSFDVPGGEHDPFS